MINNLVYTALLESWVLSDDDFYYNFDDWINNKNKILFIVGLSGSGKTTLGKQLVDKYNGTYIAVDDIWQPLIREYKKKTGKVTSEIQEEEFIKIDNIVVEKLKVLFNSNFKNKTIIEGIQIVKLDKKYLKNQSIVVKGSSYFKSFYRAVQRDFDNFAKKGITRFLDHYWHYLKMSKGHQHMIDDLKNYLKG